MKTASTKEIDCYKRSIAELLLQAARVRYLDAYVGPEGEIMRVPKNDASMKIDQFEGEARDLAQKLLVVSSLPREEES